MSLLEVRDVKKYFAVKTGLFSKAGEVKAVDGVTFSLEEGETLGLVGESGCGKTTVGRCILRLMEPTAGKVIFGGQDLTTLNRTQVRRARARIQMIFQDPFSSLNPRMNIGGIIAEPMRNYRKYSRRDMRDRVARLMERVGLHPDQMTRYPHEFSGGQRQRIGIARALSVDPLVIVCDEPVSALDVSIQAQVINLLSRLQRELNISYLFIAHDLSVVDHISRRVAVMYLGRIVELADRRTIYENPLHPYTRALLSAIPTPDPDVNKEKILLAGDLPSPQNPPPGCAFHPRCPEATTECSAETPVYREIAPGHFVSCLLA